MAEETLDERLWYLASPYTRFPYGIETAAVTVSAIAGQMIRDGENIYCPIAHSHFIAHCARLDPLDHEFWMHVDKIMVEKCDGLIVCMMPSWTKSKGMRVEIDAFKRAGKPIRYYNPETGSFVSEMLN